MKRKIIPVLVAVVLIIIIGAVSFGSQIWESYNYSSERVSLKEYFGVSGDRLAIVLGDEIMEETALLKDGRCYFDLPAVRKYFNDTFYVDDKEDLLLYTTPGQSIRIGIGAENLQSEEGTEELDYAPVIREDGNVYLEAEFLKRFANFTLEIYDWHVSLATQWSTKMVDTAREDTAVRLKGDPKSPILCDLAKDAAVEILETSGDEEWSRVKTADAVIGYVENKRLKAVSEGKSDFLVETPVTDFVMPDYPSLSLEGKLCLGWHSIGSAGGNSTLDSVAAESPGINVIAPTWFSLNDTEGGFRSFASREYVENAHGRGLQVWGVWDDFNYNNETGAGLDVLASLSSTAVRQKLVSSIGQTAADLGLDGVNIDFEKINEERGEDFAQFLRELSLECHKRNLILSVDDYVPYDYRAYYNMDVQGLVADYVIIMGYDEHWGNSGDPGSVASIDFVRDGIALGLKNVPAAKLVNALPFYCRVWKTEGVEVTDETLTIKNTEAFLSRHSLTPEWDEVTCQNYAEWTEGNALYQVWLEDEASIAVKLNVMALQELGGVAVWRLGNGTAGVWELIRSFLAR